VFEEGFRVCVWRKAATFGLLASVVLCLQFPARADKTILTADLTDKVYGMWLSQLIGNAAGRPSEGNYSGSGPNPNPSVPWVLKQTWDADDDTDIEYIAVHILETDGFGCTPCQIAEQWRTHMTSWGIYIANRQTWYLMGDGCLPPDTGSRAYNMHWYSIDSQITTEVLGAISPGLPQAAIDLTGKFAHISNTGFPVHAAQFYAAMYADAFFEPNVVTLVTDSLNAIPSTSRTHQVITDVLNWYLQDATDGVLDWRATRRKLYDKYQGADSFGRYYVWVESTVNTGATVLAILYGRGDFKTTVQIGVLAGWDSDCNPATAAGLIGIIEGFSNLPADLTDPNVCGDVYKNVYRPYLPDPDVFRPQYDTITGIAARLTVLAEQNIINYGGYITGTGPAETCHIPDSQPLVSEPEKPDPAGPSGLVADALAAGITVTPTAAVGNYNTGQDRLNLYSIIDGITDNSYNGHRPYYSYVSDANARPEKDYYQLNFSRPVRFNQLTFYEGDIVWGGINTYIADDNPRGGFFEDLTVEILRDGGFILPANLQMSPALDRNEMYQTITFTFAATVGDAVRIIGSPGGTQGFTTILELEAQGSIDSGLYVSSVRIADGRVQRSTVDKIEIRFSRDVTVNRDDIALTGTTNGTIADVNEAVFDYNSQTRWLTLSFPASLPEDTFALSLDCSNITDANGTALLDDDQSQGDGFYTITFHRLFGDADGSAMVDYRDLALLAQHWLTDPADTGLDAGKDNMLDIIDFALLAENWLVCFAGY